MIPMDLISEEGSGYLSPRAFPDNSLTFLPSHVKSAAFYG
jgi:hypothetical protein